MIARARTLSPNSITATKLLPLVPYHFFVPGYARAANDASDPHLDDVNGTGILGAASSNLGAMSSLMRWKRLISPHGVCQRPKSWLSLAVAATSDWRRSLSVARSMTYVSADVDSSRASGPRRLRTSSPQKTASDVGMEFVAQR